MIEFLILFFVSTSVYAQEVRWAADESAHGYIVHYDTIEAGEDCAPQETYRHQIDVGPANFLDLGVDDQFLISKRYKFQISSYFTYEGAIYHGERSPEPVCLEKRLNLEEIEDVEITSAKSTKQEKQENKQPSKGDGKNEKQQKSIVSTASFIRVGSSSEGRGANSASAANGHENPVGSVETRQPANRVPTLLPPLFNSNSAGTHVGSHGSLEHAEVRKRDAEDLHESSIGRRDAVQSGRKLLHDDDSVSSGRDNHSGVHSVESSMRKAYSAPESASERNYNSVILALLGALALAGLYLGLRKKV